MIAPAQFGPQLWTLLHKAAQLYPNSPSEAQREEMYSLLAGLPSIVPCASCRDESRRFLMEHLRPEILDSDESLFEFTVKFHNWVNARLGKPIWSLRDARRLYPRLYLSGF